jgi:hypothetical protein
MPVHVSHPDGRPRKSSEQATTASFAAATDLPPSGTEWVPQSSSAFRASVRSICGIGIGGAGQRLGPRDRPLPSLTNLMGDTPAGTKPSSRRRS